jgi:EAL domain-containing protein (putative c-di-GMP-specific phosphodiesterase class I)
VEQLDLVRQAGCTEVQGYLIGRPRPASELFNVISGFHRNFVAA